MKTWFTSCNGALTLSALSLLSFIGYVFLMSRYFLADSIPGDGAAMAATLGLMLLIGGWLWALSAAKDGRGRGWRAALALSGFTLLIALYDLPHPGPWPSLVTISAMLVFSILAMGAAVFQFKHD